MANQKKPVPEKKVECGKAMMAVRDTMDVLGGKWKFQIIGALRMRGKLRFMDLMREVNGVAAKMLSKELQDLEANQLVIRTVCNTKPVTVEYELSEHGKTLDKVIMAIMEWGMNHRKKIFDLHQANQSVK